MKALTRVLAAWLSFSLAWMPAAQAATLGESAAGPIKTVALSQVPTAAGLAAPALPLPSAGLAGLADAAVPRLAAPAAAALPQAAVATPARAALPAAAEAAAPRARAQQAAALPQLQAVSDAKISDLASSAFDGGILRAASAAPASGGSNSGSGPHLAPQPGGGPSTPTPEPPAPKKPSWLKRLNDSTRPGSKTEIWLERGLTLGLAAALAAPVLWKAAPFHTLMMTVPAALLLPAVVFGAVTIYRVGRFLAGRQPSAPRAPPARKTLVRAAVLGLALGLSLGAAPTVYRAPLIQQIDKVVSPADHAVRVPGDSLSRAVIENLSANPVGAKVLDSLRDRSGVIRLPVFFVRHETDAVASHVAIYDSVFLGEAEIKGAGWTVAQFLSDPAKQAQYVHDNQALFAHELTHAVQARRSPLEPGQLGNAIEYEYEAYITEHYYTHAQLMADPSAKVGFEIGNYETALDDVDGFLKGFDGDSAYKNDKHIDSPRYREWTAQLHRDWPAHQMEGYSVLVRRYAKVPFFVKRYKEKAAELSKTHGLPVPPELQGAPAKTARK